MSNCVLLQEEPILTELVKTTICCCSVTKSNLTLAIPWTVTLQALVAISFFRGSSWPRDQTCTSCIAHRFFITESPGKYPVLSSTVYNSQDTEAILMSNKRWMDKDTHAHTHTHTGILHSVQFSSVAQSCPTLCNPMNHSTPGLPVHHQLLKSTQTHVHRVGDAIRPSHPLSSPSPPAPNPSQHQGLFQWVNSSHEVAKVLEFQLQHQSFQWTPRTDL